MQIDFVLHSGRALGFEVYVADQLALAFKERGITVVTSAATKNTWGHYLSCLEMKMPDFFISFSSKAPVMSQLTGRVHLFWEYATLADSLHLSSLDNTWVGYPDRAIELLENNKLFFLPHATCCPKVSGCSPPLSVVMLDGVAESTIPFIEAFCHIPLDIFGNHIGANWLLRFKNKDKLRLHLELPYQETLRLLQSCKILVRNKASTFMGSDIWLFSAIMQGALVLIPPTPYLEAIFGPSAPFFYPADSGEVAAEVAHHYLVHENGRRKLVQDLQAIVLQSHTFYHRAQDLLDFQKKVSKL